MGHRLKRVKQSDGEKKVKGVGLFVYGAMMLATGIVSERRPAFILLAVLGLIALFVGLHTLVQRAQKPDSAREQSRGDEDRRFTMDQ